MTFYDLSFQSPLQNLLCDEMLLRLVEKQGSDDILRFWESPSYFVVLGLAGKVENDVNMDACRRDNIPVMRRMSGGGTVVQGPGCLNFSFILSKKKDPDLNDLHRSYRKILGTILEALTQLDVHADFFPLSDLALIADHKKFSGNAQRRLRDTILHHGTILYRFDLSRIDAYLKQPKAMPEYRRQRSHPDFVTNIHIDPYRLKRVLKEKFLVSRCVDALSNELAQQFEHMTGRIALNFNIQI